jgi:hypothetical protein
MFKRLIFGSAAGFLTIAGAQAADLPTRKAAPSAYVRICDAYGAGFFYIQSTDTCLKVGDLALFEPRIFNTPYSIADGFYSRSAPAVLTAGMGQFGLPGRGPSGDDYNSSRSRDTYGFGANGRVEFACFTGPSFFW